MFSLKQLRRLPSIRRPIHLETRRNAKKLPDPWDLMTGEERWQSLQYAKGNIDPFFRFPIIIKPGMGTKDCPIPVKSVHDKRVVGCLCNEDVSRVTWWYLHEGFPRRCNCNYWFILERVELPKIYEDVCPE